MKKIRVIQTKVGEIALLDNGIIRVDGHKNIHIELVDMKENDRAFQQLLAGRKAPFLILFGEDATISQDAREYFSNAKRSQIKLAEALVVPQLYHRMIARHHINSGKPSYPSNVFDNEAKAQKWLLQFLALK